MWTATGARITAPDVSAAGLGNVGGPLPRAPVGSLLQAVDEDIDEAQHTRLPVWPSSA